jgi:hypothetical protein
VYFPLLVATFNLALCNLEHFVDAHTLIHECAMDNKVPQKHASNQVRYTPPSSSVQPAVCKGGNRAKVMSVCAAALCAELAVQYKDIANRERSNSDAQSVRNACLQFLLHAT